MEYMRKLENKLCQELEDISKQGNLSKTDYEEIHLLTDTVKNIYKIEALKGESSYGEYSRRYRDRDYEGEYGDGYSRRRRDSRGRYMNGYSHGEKEELMDMLESAMAAAGSERDKEKNPAMHGTAEQRLKRTRGGNFPASILLWRCLDA